MKKFKIILDTIMLICMILLMNDNITGLYLHELLGIGIFFIFLFHKILNFKFIKNVCKNLFNDKLTFKTKFIFILDIILIAFTLANIVTGIFISNFFLTSISYNISVHTHKFFAWWNLILISIHIGLHLDSIIVFITKNKIKDNKIIKTGFIFIYIIIALLAIMSLSKYSIYNKILTFSKTPKATHQSIQEKDYSNNYQQEKQPHARKQRQYRGKKRYQQKNSNREYRKMGKNKESKKELNEFNNRRQHRRQRNKYTIFDVIYIICFFMGGTYYTNKIVSKLYNKKTQVKK